MKSLKQLMIILLAYMLGAIIQSVFNLPIPGTVLGLIFLFIGLYTKIIKIEMIEDICNTLISHMAFLFLPAGVGLMTSFGLLKGKVISFLIIIFVSTIVVWLVTAYVVKLLRKVCAKDERHN
ncbi:MAG: CidA/LrgA family protein [Clostridiales bacterium]|nr:CidA/LrgA family protein [Clostridiales bacterium]